MIRLFAAIAMPEEVVALLSSARAPLPGAAWRPAESLHLTLTFVGDVDETRAADLKSELEVVGGEPFGLRLAGVGSFGDTRGERAIWAGVEGNEPLRILARRCEVAARRAGLAARRRAWRPHVTLAYLRGSDPDRVAAWIQANNLLRSPEFSVSGFGLYSSWRSSAGSTYRLERLYRLS